jgi:hypothetical protein
MKLTVMLSKKHPKLFPQFAPPETWRTWDFHIVIESKSNARIIRHKEDPRVWEEIKVRIRTRDDHTCRYCGSGLSSGRWFII